MEWKSLPSWEVTYPIQRQLGKMNFLLPQAGICDHRSLEGPNPYASSSVGWGRLIWFPGIIQVGPQGWPCLPLLAVAAADRLPGLCMSSRASSRTALGRQGGGRYRGPREPDQWPREWWGWWPNINPQGWWFFTKILKVRWFVEKLP